MEICSLFDKPEYINEYGRICVETWSSAKTREEINFKVNKKIDSLLNGDDNLITCLILIDENILIGFISLFKTDGDERKDLTPWYATMYVKSEYRGRGYSKILNNAILKEAKFLGYNKVYLKTDLINYYEKFGAKYIEDLSNGEKLYYIDLKDV